MKTAAMEISVAWWPPLYLRSLALFCVLTGCSVDEAKVTQWAMRAVRVKVVM